MDLVWGLALLLMDGYSRPLPFGKKEFLGGKINTPTIKTERLILLLQKKGIVLMRQKRSKRQKIQKKHGCSLRYKVRKTASYMGRCISGKPDYG